MYVEIITPEEKTYNAIKEDIKWKYSIGSSPLDGDTLDLSKAFQYYLQRYSSGGYVDKIEDAGTYYISLNANHEIISTIGSNSSDYTISCDTAIYEIYRREIQIVTPSKTVYYSGVEVYAVDPGTIIPKDPNSLLQGHTLGPALTGNAFTVIPAYETCEEGKDNEVIVWVFDKDGNNISDNYNISNSEWGTIKVLKRPVVVTSGTASSVYAGSATSAAFRCKEFTMVDLIEGLPTLDSAIVSSIIPTKKVNRVTDGLVNNEFNFKATYGDDLIDISGNFEVTKVYGTIHLTQRPLTVGFNSEFDDSHWYSGEALDVSKLLEVKDGTSLGKSDMLNAKLSLKYIRFTDAYGNPLAEPVEEESIVAAGQYYVIIDKVTITKSDGTLLTENYDITIDETISKFIITINPRTVEITSDSVTKVWDGKDLSSPSVYPYRYYYDNDEGFGLLDNHEIKAKTDGYYSVLPALDENGNKVIGSIDNIVEYEIYDINTGEIVTQNYNVDMTTHIGKLTVVEYFKIDFNPSYEYTENVQTISLATGTCVDLNNNIISNLTYTINVDSEDMFEIDKYDLTPDFDSVTLYVNGVDWTEEYKDYLVVEDCLFKYQITTVYLRIKPKDLTTLKYNGEYQSCTPDKFEDGINYEILGGRLLPGHYPVIETEHSLLTPSKKSNNYITSIRIEDANGNPVTDKYNIIYNGEGSTDTDYKKEFYAKLWVNKLELSYVTGSAEKEYDGTPLSSRTFEFDEESKAILEKLGHTIVMTTPSITFPGEKSNTGSSYVVYDRNGKVVSGVYTFKCNPGTLKVTPKTIWVETPDVEFKFDTQNHSCDVNDVIVVGGLIDGHKIVITKTTTSWQPIIIDNEVTAFKVYDANGNDVTAGYVIDYVKCGQLIIR